MQETTPEMQGTEPPAPPEPVATVEQKAMADTDEMRRLIHELHQHQAELEQAVERYAERYENAPLAYFTIDEDGGILDANRAAAGLLGVEQSHLPGQSLNNFVAAENQALYLSHHRAVLASRRAEQVILAMHKQDGTPFYGQIDSCAVSQSPGDRRLRVMISNTTRLIQAELSLQRSEERYRGLVQHIPEVVFSIDSNLTISYVSARSASIMGFPPGELLHTSFAQLLTRIHADDRDRVAAAVQNLLIGGEDYVMEIRFQRKDGEWIWARVHAMRSTDDQGRIRIDGLFSDITEQHEAQEQIEEFNQRLEWELNDQRQRIERMERRRADMEKLAATGRLAAAIAHEINNPLAGIKNSFQVIKRGTAPDHPQYRFFEMIDRELNRVSEIIRQMYLLYQPTPRTGQDCDTAAALKDVLQILDSTIRSREVKVTLDITPKLPHAAIAEGEFRQIAYNVIHNALQASEEQPCESCTLEIALFEESGAICFRVKDCGPGIPADVLPHIFEPFFTSRMSKTEPSMGLGLSVTRSLAEAAGGKIAVDTTLGTGSTFSITLPCATQ